MPARNATLGLEGQVPDKHTYEDRVVGPDGIQVIHCQTCRFAHQYPIPDPGELAEMYKTSFWEDYKPEALQQVVEQQDWWHMTYTDWLMMLHTHQPGTGNLLDVGCGYGYFAKSADDMGWLVDGVDISPKAVSYADSVVPTAAFYCRPWEEHEGRYQVVSVLWLIEHLNDPQAFLAKVRNWLDDDGLFLVVAPNEWTEAQQLADEKAANPRWWIDPTHINYFNFDGMEALLERNGFKVLDKMATYPMERFIHIDLDYTADDGLGRICHRLVEQMEDRSDQKARMKTYRAMAEQGEGRDMVILAQKQDYE
ncbi:hypothetical protein LCGC14_1711930 [marine sediment metagenome]|uniref:Methyltransferase type 11 domain-containing protein n=1 Tax=marine sediment metagenome TaxID=412755 RepID=A0A0F9HFF6_9ZZZZ